MATEGASSAAHDGFSAIGAGNYHLWLARTATNQLLLAAPNASSDPSPLKLWDLGDA